MLCLCEKRNKMDELQVQFIYFFSQHEFRDTCLLAFTHALLRDGGPELSIYGFGAPVCLDQDAIVTGMSQGREICLYQKKTANVIVSICLCPHYLSH